MYAILQPDDGQSNRPKHVGKMERIHYIHISCVARYIKI